MCLRVCVCVCVLSYGCRSWVEVCSAGCSGCSKALWKICAFSFPLSLFSPIFLEHLLQSDDNRLGVLVCVYFCLTWKVFLFICFIMFFRTVFWNSNIVCSNCCFLFISLKKLLQLPHLAFFIYWIIKQTSNTLKIQIHSLVSSICQTVWEVCAPSAPLPYIFMVP